ncbi:ROK family protein [Trichloromonas sp.]|uniref:ROK family protein n=1 Tax=Trichloromonas sp. TaxID=3069249 RepID=UPI003D8130AD
MRSAQAAIGIDLGGTNCRAALVTSAGRTGDVLKVATRMADGYSGFLATLAELCGRLLDDSRARGMRVSAVGMGAPGIISREGRVRVSPNLPELNGQDLAADLADRLDLPTVVINDANAICWGEALFGAGRSFSSFLTVTLGTGVGGGLVLDRRIWAGADGAAGEIGHLTVVPEGRPCGCGNRGCLEQYASARGIVLAVLERLAAGQKSSLAELAAADLTSLEVAAAARSGDALALAVFAEAGRALGQALAGVANLLNLDGAVVTGGASESFDLMLPLVSEEIRQRAFEVSGRRLQIVRGELGDDAGILGAAGMVLN